MPPNSSENAYGYPTYPATAGPQDGFAWLRIVLEKLWLIVLAGIAGFFAAYGYLAHQAPLYQATGTLQVEPPRQDSGWHASG
jgi:hypothetical protein